MICLVGFYFFTLTIILFSTVYAQENTHLFTVFLGNKKLNTAPSFAHVFSNTNFVFRALQNSLIKADTKIQVFM